MPNLSDKDSFAANEIAKSKISLLSGSLKQYLRLISVTSISSTVRKADILGSNKHRTSAGENLFAILEIKEAAPITISTLANSFIGMYQ